MHTLNFITIITLWNNITHGLHKIKYVLSLLVTMLILYVQQNKVVKIEFSAL